MLVERMYTMMRFMNMHDAVIFDNIAFIRQNISNDSDILKYGGTVMMFEGEYPHTLCESTVGDVTYHYFFI